MRSATLNTVFAVKENKALAVSYTNNSPELHKYEPLLLVVRNLSLYRNYGWDRNSNRIPKGVGAIIVQL